jgi:hypothetical protein
MKRRRMTLQLTDAQYLALTEEAARTSAREGGRADPSAIVRALLDEWMKRRTKRGTP